MRRTIVTGRWVRWTALLAVLAVAGVISATFARAEAARRVCENGMQAIELDVSLRGAGIPICLPIAGVEAGSSHIDARYGDAARAVLSRYGRFAPRVGHDGHVCVVCWDHSDWRALGELFAALGHEYVGQTFGFTSVGHDVLNLSPGVCGRLDALAYEKQRAETRAASMAVRTLIHEALHLAGVHGEGETQCYANQLTGQIAVELGTDAAYGEVLTAINWDSDRERRAGTVYDSAECHENGPFDLMPGSTVWNHPTAGHATSLAGANSGSTRVVPDHGTAGDRLSHARR